MPALFNITPLYQKNIEKSSGFWLRRHIGNTVTKRCGDGAEVVYQCHLSVLAELPHSVGAAHRRMHNKVAFFDDVHCANNSTK